MIDNSYQDYIYVKSLKNKVWGPSSALLVTIFITLLIILFFTNGHEFLIFSNWDEIGVPGLIQLGTAIMLCFFIPGYAIVHILSKKYTISRISGVLFSYLLSILVTGLTAYVSALSFDSAVSESKYLFIAVYLAILGFYLFSYLRAKIRLPIKLQINNHLCYHFMYSKIIKYLKMRTSEFIVFGSLFMLIVVSTYVLYGGITIGDQWYHQGRALLFMSGSIREAVLLGGEVYYPPFQSALLAALTTLSEVPLVNAYASIAFLNTIPVFAFYYFFSAWVPTTMRRATLLACSLFMLSAGFGWIYLLGIFGTPISEQSSLDNIRDIAHLDIVRLSNFVIATAPDFSTALVYIALPAGLVLLGLVRTCIDTKFNILIVTAISVLGIVSHYEFYFFIIVASVLPLIFRMKSKSSMYASFLVAISIVNLLDITTPGNFYTSEHIIGLPLLHLVGLFVFITWIIYTTRRILQKTLQRILLFPRSLGKLQNQSNHGRKFKLIAKPLIVFLAVYLYLLTFIVLSALSLDTTTEHTLDSSVPWYLYPMKFGVLGLVGLGFVLSYLFKKFEKPVFVFGIIIITSLILGPYYDAHRFSKYAMVGIIGFASLMLYKILTWRAYHSLLRNVAVISLVVTFCGLSTLIYIGYISLILQTQDYINTSSRRNFPSASELHLYEDMYGIIDVGSNRDNVISFPNQYNIRTDGVIAKVQAFLGIPFEKLRQSPLTLNASTINALYHHLAYSNARYIIVPKLSAPFENSVTQPTVFALNHFKKFYEDSNYMVVEVPPLEPPNGSKTDVAIVYNEDEQLPLWRTLEDRTLSYNNKTFNFKGKEESVTIQKDNATEPSILLVPKLGNTITIWSKAINQDNISNSMETRFRVTPENENIGKSSIGLKWREGDIEYYTKLSNDGLELYQKSKGDKYYKNLSKNTELELKNWMWYTLRIESGENTTKIYINNVLEAQVPKTFNGLNSKGISKIGLVSYNDRGEFRPIKLWDVSTNGRENYDYLKYYSYYYPFNILALSKIGYDLFKDGDLSVFSSKTILVPDSLKPDKYTLKEYLEYILKGGKLFVVNSDNNFNGTFSRLVSIQSNRSEAVPFTHIAGNNNQNNTIEIPGMVKKQVMKSIPNTEVIAWYGNSNNKTVAPFAIERKFANNGSIVLINAEGYFNAISTSPRQYFQTLSNISDLIGLDSDKVTTFKNTALPMKGFIGDMGVQGEITLNSSSFSLPPEDSNPHLLNATRVKIYNRSNDSPIILNNLLIRDLKFVGDSEVFVNFTGNLKLPEMGSDQNYITATVPNGFNMTVRLPPQKLAYMEIIQENGTHIGLIEISNDSKVDFFNIRALPPLESVPVMLKRPEITVNGNVNLKYSNFDGYLTSRGALDKGPPFNFHGKLKSNVDFVDHYNEPYHGATKTQYITYLQSLTLDGQVENNEDLIKLPGDIASKAKEGLPLVKILSSSTNIIALVVLAIITTAGVLLLRKIYPTSFV